MVSASRKKKLFCLYSLLYPLSKAPLIHYSSIRPDNFAVCKIKSQNVVLVSFMLRV